ncbi:RHS repeat-associated core domain-containing protein [Pseudomonas putida]
MDQAYTPYGYSQGSHNQRTLLGFNGEQEDLFSGCYHLGNGYRLYLPALQRFGAPDSWSPFGEGGLNSYCYCAGDPVNRADPTGHLDFSHNRVTANRLREQARRRQPAQQRVDALRARLAQRNQPQTVPQRFGPPLARQQEALAPPPREAIHQSGNRNPLANPINANSPQEQPAQAPVTPVQASQLYERLETAYRHEQRFIENIRYVAPGTELFQQYHAAMIRIRADVAAIRARLDVDRLSWFHF